MLMAKTRLKMIFTFIRIELVLSENEKKTPNLIGATYCSEFSAKGLNSPYVLYIGSKAS